MKEAFLDEGARLGRRPAHVNQHVTELTEQSLDLVAAIAYQLSDQAAAILMMLDQHSRGNRSSKHTFTRLARMRPDLKRTSDFLLEAVNHALVCADPQLPNRRRK